MCKSNTLAPKRKKRLWTPYGRPCKNSGGLSGSGLGAAAPTSSSSDISFAKKGFAPSDGTCPPPNPHVFPGAFAVPLEVTPTHSLNVRAPPKFVVASSRTPPLGKDIPGTRSPPDDDEYVEGLTWALAFGAQCAARAKIGLFNSRPVVYRTPSFSESLPLSPTPESSPPGNTARSPSVFEIIPSPEREDCRAPGPAVLPSPVSALCNILNCLTMVAESPAPGWPKDCSVVPGADMSCGWSCTAVDTFGNEIHPLGLDAPVRRDFFLPDFSNL